MSKSLVARPEPDTVSAAAHEMLLSLLDVQAMRIMDLEDRMAAVIAERDKLCADKSGSLQARLDAALDASVRALQAYASAERELHAARSEIDRLRSEIDRLQNTVPADEFGYLSAWINTAREVGEGESELADRMAARLMHIAEADDLPVTSQPAALNARLLEALQSVLAFSTCYQLRDDEQCVLDARAAIAAATEGGAS